MNRIEIETLAVIAPKGKTCPMELSREVITDCGPRTVQNNTYYRRRLAEGSLLLFSETLSRAEPETALPKRKEAKK